jgi:hypothetical protein
MGLADPRAPKPSASTPGGEGGLYVGVAKSHNFPGNRHLSQLAKGANYGCVAIGRALSSWLAHGY